MDQVTLNGKVYERSAVVAKRHGYTADYLGQLSRSGKVDAELVGRSWYVHSPSVEAYKEGIEDPDECAVDAAEDTASTPVHSDDAASYSVPVHRVKAQPEAAKETPKWHISPTGSDEKSFNINLSRPTEKSESTSPAKKTPTTQSPPQPDSVIATASVSRPHERYARWRQAAYESDDTELVPGVSKADSAAMEAAEDEEDVTAFSDRTAQSIRVHSTSDQYSIVNSGPPSVRLRGKISISANEDRPDSGDYTEAHTAVQQRIRNYNEHKRPPAAAKSASATGTAAAATPSPQPAVDDEEPEDTPEAVVPNRSHLFWIALSIGLTIVVSVLLLSLVRVATYDSVDEVFATSLTFQPISTLWHELLALVLN